MVVGAGYTGTELTAQGALFTAELRRAHPALRDQRIRWLLLDLAPRVLPELDQRLSATADRVLRRRGVEVLLGTSIVEASTDAVQLTTGAADREGPACGRRAPRRPGAPRAVRLRRRRGGAGPGTSRCADRDDRPARHPAGQARRAQRRGSSSRDLAAPVPAPRPRFPRGPRRLAGRGEPAGSSAVRPPSQGADPRIPSGDDAGLVRSGAVPLDSAAPELPAALPRLD